MADVPKREGVPKTRVAAVRFRRRCGEWAWLLGAVAGSSALCGLSTLQKMWIGAPIHLNGYVIPIGFGGLIGAICGWLLRHANRKAAHLQDSLDQLVCAKAAEEKTNRHLEAICSDLRRQHQALENANQMMVHREEQMVKLKKKINALCVELGREPECGEQGEPGALPPGDRCAPEEVNWTGLLNVELLQEVLQSFCATVGVAAGVVDLDGRVVVGVNWQRVCTDCHCEHQSDRAVCYENEAISMDELCACKNSCVRRCRNGLFEAVAPIRIHGTHVANAVVGQYHRKSPHLKSFRARAKKMGFEPKRYLDAVSTAPVISDERVQPLLDFVAGFAGLVAEEGQDKSELLRSLRQLESQQRAAWNLLEDTRRAERALHASEQKFRSIYQYSRDALVIADFSGFLDCNRAALELFGYASKEEFCQLHPGSASPRCQPDGETSMSKANLLLRAGIRGRTGVFEWTHCRKDGSVFPTEIRMSPIEWDGKKAVHAVLRDITDRKRSELSVRTSEERYRNLITNMKDIPFSVSVAGAFLFVGPQVRRYGFDENELRYRSFRELILPEDWEVVRRDLEHTIATGEQLGVSFRCRTKDDRVVWFEEVGCAIRDASGRVVHIFGILRDISRRKQADADRQRLEEQLRQAQKMEAVGMLAGGIAHDFNNILQSIIGNGELAISDLPSGHPALGPLEDMMTASARAASLVRKLLAFGRKQVLLREQLDLNRLVRDQVDLLKNALGQSIELHVDCRAGMAPIYADRGQLERILLSLATNAREAMPVGGRLDIRTDSLALTDQLCRAHAWTLMPGTYALLELKDTGCGMDAATQTRIFEPFFTTKGSMGTGLGLPTVYGIVRQHGGEIDVESRPKHGTTFRIYFPVHRSKGANWASGAALAPSKAVASI